MTNEIKVEKADRYREEIVNAVRRHHRHGQNDSIVDALHFELADLSLNTLTALATALTAYKRAVLGARYGIAVSAIETYGVPIAKPYPLSTTGAEARTRDAGHTLTSTLKGLQYG